MVFSVINTFNGVNTSTRNDSNVDTRKVKTM
jgi:hypothetical protein